MIEADSTLEARAIVAREGYDPICGTRVVVDLKDGELAFELHTVVGTSTSMHGSGQRAQGTAQKSAARQRPRERHRARKTPREKTPRERHQRPIAALELSE